MTTITRTYTQSIKDRVRCGNRHQSSYLLINTMIRSCVFFAICIAASGINGRPQATFPFFNNPISSISPAIIRPQPVYLRPSGPMIYLAGGLPMNFRPPILLPVPLREGISPLTLLPYFSNQFNPVMISNGLYKQRASTPPTSILSESENQTAVSITVHTEVATEFPTAPTQSIVNLTSPNPTIGSIPISEVEQVTQPSTANPSSSVSSTSPTFLINSTSTSDGDYNFDYSVNNLETGDVKSHGEKRLNGVVTGYYMLLEADETIRKVNYTADENGFRATVSKLPVPSNK